MDFYYLNAVTINNPRRCKVTEQHSCFCCSTQYSQLQQRSHQMHMCTIKQDEQTVATHAYVLTFTKKTATTKNR